MGNWCWYGIRMDFLAIFLMGGASAICFAFREKEDPVLVAMTLTYIIQLESFLIGLLYSMGDLERQMVSVQRCFEVLKIPQERQTSNNRMIMPATTDPLSNWPSQGHLQFKNVHLRYRPTTELVLKGLSFEIEGGQKVGIVGRTGAGKSTISLSLARIVEIEQGEILLDGLNLSDLQIDKVRESITIIPQDPTLFTGTLRFNVDPAGAASDFVIIDLLRRAGLQSLLERQGKEKEEEKPKGKKKKAEKVLPVQESSLNLEITENGGNLSSGEKQLICICRAILRRNKLILLDEATANIDLVAEQKIQQLIKEQFRDCTMITIAHRLQTIIESDKVLVLGDGQVLEFDQPSVLLQNPASHFTQLINELEHSEKE